MDIMIWGDGGSHNNGKYKGIGACATVIVSKGLYPELGKKEISKGFTGTTNNEMELLAVINGLSEIVDRISDIEDNSTITVTSDSAYVINCINQCWYVKWRMNGWRNSNNQPVANKDLWENLLEKYEFIRSNLKIDEIKFVHVKGHNGNLWNERCDKLCTSKISNIKKMIDRGLIEL